MAKNVTTLSLDSTDYSLRPFGTCSTSNATQAKAVTCSDFNLHTGATILVKFSENNISSNPTLNVGSTGAKSIRYHGASLGSYSWKSGDIVEFYYDGTNWNIIGILPVTVTGTATSSSGNSITFPDITVTDGLVTRCDTKTHTVFPENASVPTDGLLPNVFYNLGSRSSLPTLNTTVSVTGYKEWMFSFKASTAFSDTSKTWAFGMKPSFQAGSTYHISVVGDCWVYGKF